MDSSNFEEAISTRLGSGKARPDSRSNHDTCAADGDQEIIDEGARDAFRRAQTQWPIPQMPSKLTKLEGRTLDASEVAKMKKGVKTSQQQQTKQNEHLENLVRNAEAKLGREYSTSDIQTWLEKVRHRRNKHGEPYLKAAQFEMLSKVCERICVQLREEDNDADYTQPFLWLMHGGPGVGKSEVIKLLRELFVSVLHWNMGVDFQMAALQAVMAEQLGGDTLHHSCGIQKGRTPTADEQGQVTRRQTEVAKSVLQWKWLIIDEISMVSSQLLAEVDVKLRNIVRNLGTSKLSESGDVRPFGGINVLFVGDFWQLEPPRGGLLGNIPVQFIRRAKQYDPKPDAAHGESIFWGVGEHSVQGVTELDECVRTEDPWLFEVQEEMRKGQLSEDNWNFLHGRPTTVPGSWENNHCACKNLACEKLVGAADVQSKECSVCKS